MESLVHYDSSSDEEDNIALKRKAFEDHDKDVVKMPKLPTFFEFTKKPNTIDHQGRTRTVPHQADHWATHVYCKVDLTEDIKQMSEYLKDVEIVIEPHISLSRPNYLRKFQLDGFVAKIKEQVKDVKPFKISFAQLTTLNNDENTRSFLTLEIGKGYNELFECMKRVDHVMNRFNKATFYDPPRFHASIAWSLKEELVKNVDIPIAIIEELIQTIHPITTLYIKMGNKVEQISF